MPVNIFDSAVSLQGRIKCCIQDNGTDVRITLRGYTKSSISSNRVFGATESMVMDHMGLATLLTQESVSRLVGELTLLKFQNSLTVFRGTHSILTLDLTQEEMDALKKAVGSPFDIDLLWSHLKDKKI